MILAILQARVSSTRLPGKVLKPILGKPMLELHLERLFRVDKIDRLLVATSSEDGDKRIADLCRRLDVECFQGNLNDVLDRYYKAAAKYRPDTVVRLTGDCPLADPEVIDRGISYFQTHDFDYVSNCIERTYPIGLDTEIFTYRCLERAWNEAALPYEREHVTPFIRNNPDRFRIGHFKYSNDLSHHRWTVDEPADFEFVKQVYEALYPDKPAFSMHDVLHLLDERPYLTEINYHIMHGDGHVGSFPKAAQYQAGEDRQYNRQTKNHG